MILLFLKESDKKNGLKEKRMAYKNFKKYLRLSLLSTEHWTFIWIS